MTQERYKNKKTLPPIHRTIKQSITQENKLTNCNILPPSLVEANHIAKISRLNTTCKQLAGIKSRNRPNKPPRSKNAIRELADEHTPEHQIPEKNKILQEETEDRPNFHTEKLTARYELFDIILTGRQCRKETIAKEFT